MPPFASQKQRRYVMWKLKKEGFRKKPKEIGVTPTYFRARMKDPKEFKKGSLRTHDIGRKGGTKLIIGRPHGMTTTRTQSVLIERPKKAVYFDGTKFKDI